MSRICVCPLSHLEAQLQSSGARWMVSLMGPGKAATRPAQISAGFLALEFHDIAGPREGYSPPSAEQITQLLDFFAQWDQRAPLLIHCWMGISRSTAAAAIALAQLNPEQDMTGLAEKLRRSSPSATPNSLMIALADEQLELNGRLSSAIAAIGRGAEASQGTPFSIASTS
ncbi:MAG: protein-tyrosine phosphatase family protein [Rhizobiaceae bacterium]